jgi:hypothetical protein
MRLAAFALALGCSTAAHAAILVTQAHVSHDYVGLPEFGNAYIGLSSNIPGNHFDTYTPNPNPLKTGAILDINQNEGSLRIYTGGRNNIPVAIGYSFATSSGSIKFTAIDGNFGVNFGPIQPNSATVNFVLTNVATGQKREIGGGYYPGLHNLGDLPQPAPAGDYTLSWTSSQVYMAGTTAGGYQSLEFVITPEPASFLLVCGSAALLRRRRVT